MISLHFLRRQRSSNRRWRRQFALHVQRRSQCPCVRSAACRPIRPEPRRPLASPMRKSSNGSLACSTISERSDSRCCLASPRWHPPSRIEPASISTTTPRRSKRPAPSENSRHPGRGIPKRPQATGAGRKRLASGGQISMLQPETALTAAGHACPDWSQARDSGKQL